MFPTTTSASGKGIRFRLFGFPTKIEPLFFAIILMLGFSAGSVQRIVLWGVVVLVSVLLHELGHAFAARRLGAKPTITLHGFGGVTMWRPPRNPTRWNLISVAIAGPFAGMLLGGVIWFIQDSMQIVNTDVSFFVRAMVWVNLGWGMLNLLPVLPLDGGHVMAEVLPGSRAVRARRAAIASVIFGVLVAVAMIYKDLLWGAMVFGWAVASNLTMLKGAKKAETLDEDLSRATSAIARLSDGDERAAEEVRQATVELPAQYQAGFKLAAVEAALFGNLPEEARDLLNRIPAKSDAALYALVSAAETHGRQGLDELGELFHRNPTPYRSRWLALGLWYDNRLGDVVNHLAALDRDDHTAELVTAAQDIAEWAGDGPLIAQLTGLQR